MNAKQIKLLKRALSLEPYVADYEKDYKIGSFLNRKSYRFKKKMRVLFKIKHENNVFELICEDIGGTLYYAIVKNNKILWHCITPVFAPASDAFHILTEVYHGYKEGTGNWEWFGKHEGVSISRPFWKKYNKTAKFPSKALETIDYRVGTEEEISKAYKKIS